VINDHEFVLEGFPLYAAVGVPLILGMLVCRSRSGFARICIVAFAIIIVSAGVASVYAAMRGEPWAYMSQHTGQYIDLLGGMFLLGTLSAPFGRCRASRLLRGALNSNALNKIKK
jgi:hypothetical protein